MFQLTESKNKIYHLIMDGPKDKMHVIDYDFIKGLEKHIDKIEKLKDIKIDDKIQFLKPL